ncbi:MAG: hypothetical protein ACRD3J_16345 [Thermoanaerobaculia bacterium]
MTTTESTEERPKKIRTIQTGRFGKSKVNMKLATKTLREMIKEREQKQNAASAK